MIEIKEAIEIKGFRSLKITLDIRTPMQLALLTAILNSGKSSAEEIIGICGTYRPEGEIKFNYGFRDSDWQDLMKFIKDNDL
ncbi:MAG: hypothetical protein JKY67_14020 [Pseudomonadales bacterium]|nr:hypothetical protein [Pseudomonadales bacterium]